MKKIIIHFGYHKTGTSALQETFSEYREELRSKGLYYPQSILGFPAPQELSWSLISQENRKKWMNVPKPYQEIYHDLLSNFESSGCHTLIVSSEDLTYLEKEVGGLNLLHEMFNGYDIQLICYVRNQVDFLLSLYGHGLRVGAINCTFEEHVRNNVNLKIGEFDKRIALWELAFGQKVKVCKYEPKGFFNKNICDDFFNSLNININIAFPHYKSNKSLHPWCRDLMKNVKDIEFLDKEEVVDTIIDLSNRLPKVSARECYMNEDFYLYLKDYYTNSSTELASKYNIIF
ncbi:hypothetical protein [uncultured Vibrio sp.]|uniref:hypothetical protein n=1 Tax=uncultured Vibrio sp. TaxID=114054 RepID=UPI00260185C0|nr:hypothetical protein [uncultured Vibrio sp.]